jgi:UrcA family protein
MIMFQRTRAAINPAALGAAILVFSMTLGVPTVSASSIVDGRFAEAVSYGDLNMTDTQSSATLYRRIRNAASRVCASLANPSPRPGAYGTCTRAAISRAVADVNLPTLTEYHASQQGNHSAPAARLADR